MIKAGWRVHYVPSELPVPRTLLPFVAELPGDWDRWLAQDNTPERTPFLISPTFEYDVELKRSSCRPAWWGMRGTHKPITRGTWQRS